MLDLTDRILSTASWGLGQGASGITLDPGFASNQWVYIYWAVKDAKAFRLSRFTLSGNALGAELPIIEIPYTNIGCCHTAGSMAFDFSGNLYMAVGNTTNNGSGYGGKNPYSITLDPYRGWLAWGEIGPDEFGGNDTVITEEHNLVTKPGFMGWPYFVGKNQRYRLHKDPLKPTNLSKNNAGLTELPPAPFQQGVAVLGFQRRLRGHGDRAGWQPLRPGILGLVQCRGRYPHRQGGIQGELFVEGPRSPDDGIATRGARGPLGARGALQGPTGNSRVYLPEGIGGLSVFDLRGQQVPERRDMGGRAGWFDLPLLFGLPHPGLSYPSASFRLP